MAVTERPRERHSEHDFPSSMPEQSVPRILPDLHTDLRPYCDIPTDDLLKELIHRFSTNAKANESLQSQTKPEKRSPSTRAPLTARFQSVLRKIAKVLNVLETSGPNLLRILQDDREKRRLLVQGILRFLGKYSLSSNFPYVVQ